MSDRLRLTVLVDDTPRPPDMPPDRQSRMSSQHTVRGSKRLVATITET